METLQSKIREELERLALWQLILVHGYLSLSRPGDGNGRDLRGES